MKKRFLLAIVALILGLLTLGSCQKQGMIYDIYPVEFVFEVTDAHGNNLFDESTPGNWLQEPFSATFQGKEYLWPSVQAKAYLAELRGFYIYPKWHTTSDVVFLRFGEVDGAKNWDTDLTISWPDGSQDIINVKHTCRYNMSGAPKTKTKFKVNGEPVDDRLIRLKK